jgi:soluble lytic murein transglycosylase-like protein
MTANKIAIVLAAGLLATSAFADETGHFRASEIQRRATTSSAIMISNSSHAITAYRFFNNVREALFSLKTAQSLRLTPFGSTVYNSGAPVSQQMPQYLAAIISEAGAKHGVDPRLVAAVATRESRLNPNAKSPVGACGLMQLMPATARYLGVNNIFDPRENAFAGARYLRTLLDTFHGDLDLTLAAYNAGPGAVQKFNGVPPYRETQQYVKLVRANYERSLRD